MAKSKKLPPAGHSTKAPISVENMSLAEFAAAVKQARQHVASIDALFPGLVSKTIDQRLHSEGKLRTGEDAALGAVLDAADAQPQYFVSLADKDAGSDPDQFETQVLRDRLARRNLLAEVSTTMQALSDNLSDTVLHFGEEFRPVVLAAYQIGKGIAPHDPKLARNFAKPLDFYGGIARKGAKTRAAAKKKG